MTTPHQPCSAVLDERGTYATCQKAAGHDGSHVRWRDGDDIVWGDGPEKAEDEYHEGHDGERCYEPGCREWITGASDFCEKHRPPENTDQMNIQGSEQVTDL